MPPKDRTRTRLEGGVLLGSRQAVVHFTHRHLSTVRRRCEPIACDTETHAFLYDLDQCDEMLSHA